MHKVIIQARINEYAMRSENPNVPWTDSEIVQDARDCVEAGASIIHFHARKEDGTPDHSYDKYKEVMSRIRLLTNAMLHPTMGADTVQTSPKEKMQSILQLVEDGLHPEFGPIDMVSSNMDFFDWEKKEFLSDEGVFINTTRTLRYFAETMRDADIKPILGIWHIPALRLTAAFVEAGYLSPPVSMTFALMEGGGLAAHPGTVTGLRAFMDFLPATPFVWETLLYGGNLLPLISEIVERGGHIAVGLGDYAYPELGYPTNAQLIDEVVRQVRACGADVATGDEAREILDRKRI